VAAESGGESHRAHAPHAPPPARRPVAAAPAALDVDRVADQVMRTLDRRLTAYRERRGRVL
jgi:hypothetical protein